MGTDHSWFGAALGFAGRLRAAGGPSSTDCTPGYDGDARPHSVAQHLADLYPCAYLYALANPHTSHNAHPDGCAHPAIHIHAAALRDGAAHAIVNVSAPDSGAERYADAPTPYGNSRAYPRYCDGAARGWPGHYP